MTSTKGSAFNGSLTRHMVVLVHLILLAAGAAWVVLRP
jgi:hypothetical protein